MPVSSSVRSYTAAAQSLDGDRVFYRMHQAPGDDALTVQARRFTADGVPIWSDWVTVSDPAADPSPADIDAVDDALGRTAAAWVDYRGSAVSLYYQIMDAGGSRVLPTDLRLNDQAQPLVVAPRKPVEGAKSRPDKLDVLRAEWAKLTDTHQFLRLCSKLRMNRLGAYRIAGAPFVRQLDPSAADAALQAVQAAGIEVMIFVGNRGCIQIHTGPVHTLTPMGPWQNVMDPGFNLHLRRDKVAEIWAVEKPTQRGPAVSVEAFDAEGGLIFQIFGVGKEGRDQRPEWAGIVAGLGSVMEAAE